MLWVKFLLENKILSDALPIISFLKKNKKVYFILIRISLETARFNIIVGQTQNIAGVFELKIPAYLQNYLVQLL